HEPARVDEPGQLVTSEQRLLERRVARETEVLGMREDAVDDLLRITLPAQDGRPVLWVLVERRVHLVVEVVKEGGHAPQLLVLAELLRIGADGGLDGESMAPQGLALRVLRQRLPGLIACRPHGSVR